MATETTKKAWRDYLNSEIEYLCGENSKCAYSRCSNKKWDAWESCKRLMEDMDGIRMRIIRKNTFTFSCGFIFRNCDGVRMFEYITPSFHKACPVSELEGGNR